MSSKIEYRIIGRNMIDTWMNFVLESLLYDMTEIKKGKQVLNQNEFSLKIKNINLKKILTHNHQLDMHNE